MASAATRELFLDELEGRRAAVRRLVLMTQHLETAAESILRDWRAGNERRQLSLARDGAAVARPARDVDAVGRNLWVRISRLLFGASPRYRRWHWLHASTRLALSWALECVEMGHDVLHIYHDRRRFFTFLDSRVHSITSMPQFLMESFDDGARPRFDRCLIEVDFPDLANFREIYDAVRPWLKPGGVILALFLNAGGADLPLRKPRSILEAFPVCGPARIAYGGSWASLAAFRARHWVEERLTRSLKLPGLLGVPLGMVAAAPLALIGSWIESDRTLDNAFNPPKAVTSVTIEIKVG